ncbi:MAG: hypothetical protein HKM99_03860, partial [Flavobacteriaceae bacterium]|nr:hypothetical protein [Flavobacteriaceae bacterium]
MKILIALIIVLLIMGCEGKANDDKKLQDSLMSLSFDEFDQTMDGGWRTYAQNEDYETATKLIKIYLEKEGLEPFQLRVLNFHCGQMLALMNENEEAIPHMEASFKSEEDVMHWNVYVEATIAFLRKDRETFDLKKQELMEKSVFPDGDSNLKVLELLENSFDSTYKE